MLPKDLLKRSRKEDLTRVAHGRRQSCCNRRICILSLLKHKKLESENPIVYVLTLLNSLNLPIFTYEKRTNNAYLPHKRQLSMYAQIFLKRFKSPKSYLCYITGNLVQIVEPWLFCKNRKHTYLFSLFTHWFLSIQKVFQSSVDQNVNNLLILN